MEKRCDERLLLFGMDKLAGAKPWPAADDLIPHPLQQQQTATAAILSRYIAVVVRWCRYIGGRRGKREGGGRGDMVAIVVGSRLCRLGRSCCEQLGQWLKYCILW